MSIISYAQNLEDIMLWRALKDIEKGFYIDIGANDPEEDSVTKLFYDKGWSGINIEPLEQHYAVLSEHRPRDINLKCAAGSTSGEFEIWECDRRGWATMDKAVAAGHEQNGFQGKWHKVPVRTLTEICYQYVSCEIHFLKVDVEGLEKAVIEGMDLSVFRPWIIVIEATEPATTNENHDLWEHLILGQNYFHAYSDGLNRFYVASERKDILPKLKYPPNFFDDYIKSSDYKNLLKSHELEANIASLIEKLKQSDLRIKQSESRAQQAENELDRVELQRNQLENELVKLKAHKSSVLSKCSHKIKYLSKHLFLHFRAYINNSPKLRKIIIKILKSTGTYSLAKKIFSKISTRILNKNKTFNISSNKKNLSPYAQRVLTKLKFSIERKGKNEKK